MAENCWVAPEPMDAEDGFTAIESNVLVAPVPMSEITCGLLLALSTKLSVPVLVPVAVGLNVRVVVQLAPAAKILGRMGQVELTRKSPRLLVTLLIVKAVDWLLVSVTSCGGV